MKIEVVKCPCCGGSIGALDREGMVECNYCSSNLVIKLNNNPNDPKHKIIVEEAKPKEEPKVEEKLEEKVIPVEEKTKDRVIVLKDDEERRFKDISIKKKIASLASAVVVAAGMGTIGVSTFNHIKGNIEKDNKPKYGTTTQAVKIPSSYGFHDAPWEDEKAKVGHVVNFNDLTPEELDEIQRQSQEITSALIKGEISNEEALERLESVGIDVDPNYFREIDLVKEKNYVPPKQEENTNSSRKDLDSLDVIFMNDEGDTKLIHMTKGDVMACDDFGSRVMFLHPNEDGSYKDLTSDSYVELNEQYWNIIPLNELSKYNSIIYPMKDGTSILYSDEVIQVIKNKSEVDNKGKAM